MNLVGTKYIMEWGRTFPPRWNFGQIKRPLKVESRTEYIAVVKKKVLISKTGDSRLPVKDGILWFRVCV